MRTQAKSPHSKPAWRRSRRQSPSRNPSGCALYPRSRDSGANMDNEVAEQCVQTVVQSTAASMLSAIHATTACVMGVVYQDAKHSSSLEEFLTKLQRAAKVVGVDFQ